MTAWSIDYQSAHQIAKQWGTPAYVYHAPSMDAAADRALAFPAPFGLTVRFATKAAPNATILRRFANKGLQFDASSGPEAERIHRAGIPMHAISLSAQELPSNFEALIHAGLSFNACSIHQLERFGKAFPNSPVGLRFNPGLGSGGTNRTNVGGIASSFGIWYEAIDAVRDCLARYQLTPFRIHSHIGSGSDPDVWKRTARLTLDIVEAFPSVTHMNLGGGYKVGRMPDERSTDILQIGEPVADLLRDFAQRSQRRIHLEIEPGTFLVANAAVILAKVIDVVDTGADGYRFIKLNTGMTDILRPSLYGAQHPITILRPAPTPDSGQFIVVGHCCESGDILTPAPGDPEALATRSLPNPAIGDLCAIGGAGAYTAAMSAKNYNAFPESPEILLINDGSAHCIRERQSLDQILANERPLPAHLA